MDRSCRLHDLSDGLTVEYTIHTPNPIITEIAHDSRQRFATGTIYLCLSTDPQQARTHIDQAIKQGAVAVYTVIRALAEPEVSAPVCYMPELHNQITRLFTYVYGLDLMDHHFIGVTGTNGKTSVVHALSQALSGLYVGTLGIGELEKLAPTNNTTPLAPEILSRLCPLLRQGRRPVVLEASSHALAQGRLMDLPISTAVFTNLSEEHLDYHRTMTAYADSKFRLFRRGELKHAVVNIDDDWGKVLCEKLDKRLSLLTFGLGTEADIHPSVWSSTFFGLMASIETPVGQLEVCVPLIGEFNLYNIMAVIGVLLSHSLGLRDIHACLDRVTAVPGRLEQVLDAPRFIIDYAHTPDALAKALQALRPMTPGKLWCVFGCGGQRDVRKRPQMGRIAFEQADEVVLTTDNPRHESPAAIIEAILAGIDQPDRVRVIADRKDAIAYCYQQATSDDRILLAGKGHENYQIIGNNYIEYSDRSWIQQLAKNSI